MLSVNVPVLSRSLSTIAIGSLATLGTRKKLQNDPLIPNPPRNPLLVKIFKQRNSVFSRHADQVLELADIDLGRCGFILCHGLAQALQSVLVKYQVVRQFDQHAVSQQERHQLVGASTI